MGWNKRSRNGSGKVKAAEEGRIFDSWRLQLDFFPFINRCRHRFLSRLTSQYPSLRSPFPLGLFHALYYLISSCCFILCFLFLLQSMIAANRMSATVRVAALRSPTSALRTTAANAIAIQRPLIQSPLYAISRSTDSANFPVSRLLSPYASLHLTRSFHVGTPWLQQKQEQQGEKKSEESKDEKNDKSKDEGKSEKKEDAPPPPPHGDKSPWQVFRDTLQSEFKASKEWNESTKALASSAHQFSENENVKRARSAYEAASGAASTRTSTALKGTGRVIGKSASWTWNTPVVKGLRKGVNVTATGLDKATRPVRETEAYKTAVGGVKQAIDDGSSSRYGGWTEKEERRRQRQQREEMEAKSGRRKSGPTVEDPKSASPLLKLTLL